MLLLRDMMLLAQKHRSISAHNTSDSLVKLPSEAGIKLDSMLLPILLQHRQTSSRGPATKN